MIEILKMLGLVILQNASFTLVSRARNSKSLLYHGISSVLSNGVWLLVIRQVVNNFDKPTIVLKTFAAMNLGTDDANATGLPETKADSIDLEDEIVGTQVRMTADLNQFSGTLTRALEKKFSEIDMKDGGEHVMSLSRYDRKEKEKAKEFFRSKESGLSKIYEGIEKEVKSRMASEMLIMTADPNYIADPSEARAALIKPSQRNAFRYAALIQQEKNKMLKLKYALEIKRKQQMVDLLKQQAQIRASVFRDSAAKHELYHLLEKADESVSLEMGTSGGGSPTCPPGKVPDGHGGCI